LKLIAEAECFKLVNEWAVLDMGFQRITDLGTAYNTVRATATGTDITQHLHISRTQNSNV
jgi:hypothetical protein